MDLPDENGIQNLCPDLDKCQINTCEKLHSRCLTGVCIGNLQGFCQQQDYCGQHHYSLVQLQGELDKKPINGIYQHNLCYKKCNNENCKFLHPPWLQFICVDCKNQKCDKKKEGLWHTSKWQEIQKKVYELYNINKTNPEKFCNEKDCECEAQKYNFNIYCIKYFQGICPYHRCQKPHKNWEDLKDIGHFQNLQDKVVKPCIKFDENKNEFSSQPQTLQCNVYMQKNQLKLIINQVQIRPQIVQKVWRSGLKLLEIILVLQQLNLRKRQRLIQLQEQLLYVTKIDYHNFTVRPEEIEKFIKNFKVEDGDDVPEDLQGALDVAYNLNISKDPESLLQIFIITDAPCHGRKYHNLAYDQLPKSQDLEEKLKKFVTLKKRFFLSFLQIHQQTCTMETVMQNVVQNNYQSAKIADKQFSDYILFSLSSTYSRSQSIDTHIDFNISRQMHYSYNNRQNSQYCDYIDQQINQTQKSGETSLLIELEEFKVNLKGELAKLFKGFDEKNNVHIVIKIPQEIIIKYNSNTLTQDDIEKANQIANSKYKQQLIAKQLSHHFNYCCQLYKLSFTPLYYATLYLYKLDKPFKGLEILYGESFIDLQDTWKKYTNNLNYRHETINLTAFSHFTYHYTNCQIIITDLQGIYNILSDPAIHSLDERLKDDANIKNEGCCQFFLYQHPECQNICKQLGLISISLQKKGNTQTQDLKSEATRIDDSQMNQENLYKICINCNVIEKLKKDSDTFELCEQCQNLQQDITTYTCKCCNLKFEISEKTEQLFATIVEFCKECQIKQCHKTKLNCYYCQQRICLQTIKEINYNQIKIPICIDAHFFLRQVKCKICHSNYNFNTLLSQEDYFNNNYNCGCNSKTN
ncbi:unnamed protein product [Paramecium sonneborni]|uniref:Alpha-type protein kinase domain-containing protein n=1 Tax=Paramecium sonneborni TaxID=65129 RepID=A0A8S1MDU1_9CILI|nr:unnamed protein product [Paramecium sonneborni]